MYLKSLEISGFKSFAKKHTLEFNCPITGIVGPNGSGKSNVAEAFRFVLGEQSMKSMRGRRGEDLIFNGGKSQGRLNRASVKVVFDNKDKTLPLDFEEVSIERVVHRDSANEYFLNGTAVRLKDIIELLAAAHIGASGHHIISQGEADKILNANMDERREMIEDALGLKIYHYKREESTRKLDKTEENLKQVGSLRREIAPHIKFLEGQVKKIEKAREMRTELENLYKEYLKRESSYIFHEREAVSAERKGPETLAKALEKELGSARSVLEKSHTKDATSDELLKIEGMVGTARTEKDKFERELGRIEGQIASEERIAKKQKEMAASDDARMVRFSDVETFTKELTKTLNEGEKTDDVVILKNIVRSIKNSILAFLTRNKTASSAGIAGLGVVGSEHEIARLQAEKKKLSDKLETLADSERRLTSSYAALQKKIEQEKDSNRDAEKAVFRIMAEQSDVSAKLNLTRGREERLGLVENDFKRELTDAGMLIGRSVLDFEHFHVPAEGHDGRHMTDKEMATESRDKQESRRKTIEKIKVRLEDAGGGTGEEVLKEYDEAKNRDTFLVQETEDLERSAGTLKTLIAELGEKLDIEFKTGVDKINKQFQEFFALMFGGGSAGLRVVRQEKRRKKTRGQGGTGDELGEDSADEDELSGLGDLDDKETEEKEGIDISVSLPQKRIKGLMMLSGGERALTSIALLFAISQVNPPPFIILDETDAALDEANSKKYGDMIANLSKYSQLILITHNRETMSRAGVLYGVTMGSEGFSKLLSIQFEEAVQVAK